MPKTLEAKVKDTYRMGPVIAFSGHEFVRSEWRPVPAGFEPAAIVHPLLDVREIEGEEIRVTSQDYLDQVTADPESEIPGVTMETAEPEEEPKKKARRPKKEE